MRRGYAGVGLAVAMVTAGVLGAASPAAAKANTVAIGTVRLDQRHTPVVRVDVGYSCDQGSGVSLRSTATAVDRAHGDRRATAASGAQGGLICDADVHVKRLTLRPKPGVRFFRGETVKVTAEIVAPDGSVYADAERLTTL